MNDISLYTNYIIEASSSNRPMILAIRRDKDLLLPKIIYSNSEFNDIESEGISTAKIEKDKDFLVFCKELFLSPSDTNDSTSITLGKNNTQVDLYANSRRSTAYEYLDPYVSDLIFIQVDTIKYQENLRKKNTLSKIDYQEYVIKQIIEKNKQLTSDLFNTIEDINKLNVSIDKLNKQLLDINNKWDNHILFQATKNITLKKIMGLIVMFATISSGMGLISPSVVEIIETIYINNNKSEVTIYE